jgi:hypothetical protein
MNGKELHLQYPLHYANNPDVLVAGVTSNAGKLYYAINRGVINKNK